MKIKVICIGKTGKGFLEEGELTYLNRLKHYVAVERIEIADLKNAKSLTVDQIKKQEGDLILSKVNSGEQLYLLDEHGKTFTSEKFADFLQQRFNQGGHALTLVIGGPYGFSEDVYQAAMTASGYQVEERPVYPPIVSPDGEGQKGYLLYNGNSSDLQGAMLMRIRNGNYTNKNRKQTL